MSTPTQAASQARIFIDALRKLGYDMGAFMRAAGMDSKTLDDPDGRIPCSLLGAVIGRAMRERPLKNLGMRIAAETPIDAFPLVDYLVLTSDSVGQGCSSSHASGMDIASCGSGVRTFG